MVSMWPDHTESHARKVVNRVGLTGEMGQYTSYCVASIVTNALVAKLLTTITALQDR